MGPSQYAHTTFRRPGTSRTADVRLESLRLCTLRGRAIRGWRGDKNRQQPRAKILVRPLCERGGAQLDGNGLGSRRSRIKIEFMPCGILRIKYTSNDLSCLLIRQSHRQCPLALPTLNYMARRGRDSPRNPHLSSLMRVTFEKRLDTFFSHAACRKKRQAN